MKSILAQILGSQPIIVQRALFLLYGTLVLGIIGSIPHIQQTLQEIPSLEVKVLTIGSLVLIYALIIFTYFMIGRRKNWARYLFLALSIGGLSSSFNQLGHSSTLDFATAVLEIIQIGATFAAIWILFFSKPAKNWFAQSVSN